MCAGKQAPGPFENVYLQQSFLRMKMALSTCTSTMPIFCTVVIVQRYSLTGAFDDAAIADALPEQALLKKVQKCKAPHQKMQGLTVPSAYIPLLTFSITQPRLHGSTVHTAGYLPHRYR